MSFNRCSPLSSPWRRFEGSDEEEEEAHKDRTSRVDRWRHMTLVLNAARRFRYTLDSRKSPVQRSPFRSSPGSPGKRFRLGTNAVRAIFRFKEAGKIGELGLEPQQLIKLVVEHEFLSLEELGGVDGVAKALSTDKNNGIKDNIEDIQRRRILYGSNTYPRHPPKQFLIYLWEACQDVTLIILTICAIVSLALGMGTKGDWYDGASIVFTVILVIVVTACSEYKQSLQFRSLNAEKRNVHLQVLRGGRRCTISISDLVVGDVVPLNAGDQIPGDGLLIFGYSLTVDESSMTGESELVHKDSNHPFLLSGCKVVDGYGSMLITGVGMNTEWGQAMATLTDETGEETPLQVRLKGVATVIGIIGLVVAIICFFMLFVRYFVQDYKKNKKAITVVKKNVDILSVAVTIIVVAVPEGLPLAVTLALAYSMRKMMAEKSLVRHLAACETMGSATTICSDKTGTLTLNQMTVVESWVAGKKTTTEDIKLLPHAITSLIIDGIAQNSTGSIYIPEGNGDPEVSGPPTEKALLSWGLQIGMDFAYTRAKSSIVQVEPFNSIKKRAAVALKREDGTAYAHWKGAAEIILDLCESWLDGEGSERILTDEMAFVIKETISEMAAKSLRCVAFAYKPIDSGTLCGTENHWQIPESGLVITHIVGIKDPCRPGVREAVAICQAAGIKVRMVTGDNLTTAKAIASECGILVPGGLLVEGRDFRNYTDEERAEIVPNINVLARSSPSDKLLLVKSLKDMDEVVAVTGDGTNDAPALREAHIGLSMGISGTEVAKESSDIIILDDNFASIVNVVRWGRSVYENIQKFIQFQLTVNIAALLTNFVAAARSEDVPLNTVQLLWVNLIMDTLGALALATEPPTDELMKRSPIGRREPLVTNVMWRNIFSQAGYQVAVLLALYFQGDKILRLEGDATHKNLLKNTIIFNSFVFCQIFNEVNARKLQKLNVFEGILQSHLFCAVIAISCVIQIIIIQFLKKFFKTTNLTWQYWFVCVGIGFLSLPLGCLMKLVKVPEKPILNTNWRRKHKRRHRSGSKSMWKWKFCLGTDVSRPELEHIV